MTTTKLAMGVDVLQARFADAFREAGLDADAALRYARVATDAFRAAPEAAVGREPETDLAHHHDATFVVKDTQTRTIRYHCGCLVVRVQVVACAAARTAGGSG